jgi:hypothetical protein
LADPHPSLSLEKVAFFLFSMKGIILLWALFTTATAATSCGAGRTLSSTDGKCYRDYAPSMVWSWIAGSTTDTTSGYSTNSFGTAKWLKAVWSRTNSVGYVFGGVTDTERSSRIYSFNSNFSTVTEISGDCLTVDYGTPGVESSISCPPGRGANAVWLIEDQYVYVFGGEMNSINCSGNCYLYEFFF